MRIGQGFDVHPLVPGRKLVIGGVGCKDIDSRELLRHCAKLLRELGLRVVNVDATLIAEAPRMAPHIPKMVENIAADLAAPRNAVNVKATTTEKLGFTGRGEGIAAQAVCLVE